MIISYTGCHHISMVLNRQESDKSDNCGFVRQLWFYLVTHLSNDDEVRRVFKFFPNLRFDLFSLPNSKLKLRWVRLITFVLIFSTLIHFSQEEEQLLFLMYAHGRETGEWESYRALSLTAKLCIWTRLRRGVPCG